MPLLPSGPCTWILSCTSQDEGRRIARTPCAARLKLGVLLVSPHSQAVLQIAVIQLSPRQNKADAKAAARASDSNR